MWYFMKGVMVGSGIAIIITTIRYEKLIKQLLSYVENLETYIETLKKK